MRLRFAVLRSLGYCILAAVATFAAVAQDYTIDSVAGGKQLPTPMPALKASIAPDQVATDGAGNYYFFSLNCLYKAGVDGVLTRIAGDGHAGSAGNSGSALDAEFNRPQGIAVDGNGTIYVADTGNRRVQQVTPDGRIATVISGLSAPSALATDGAGNLYIADAAQNKIFKRTPAATVAIFAGNGAFGTAGDGGPAIQAQIGTPQGLAVDGQANLYIATNFLLRKVSPNGTISTVAGGGKTTPDTRPLPATQAALSNLQALAADQDGNVYVADDPRLLKVTPDGVLTTIAGNGNPGFSGDGGPGRDAQVNGVSSLAVDSARNVYFADRTNQRVRRIAANGIITTVAGDGGLGPAGDNGPAIDAQLLSPTAVAVDRAGNLYIVDSGHNRVRKVSLDGTITTVAGDGMAGNGTDGDGGPATGAHLVNPLALALDGEGGLYVSQPGAVRKVSPDGTITTMAGGRYACSCPIGSSSCGDGGPALAACMGDVLLGIGLDSQHNLFIADYRNNRVRKVSPDGLINPFAGSGMEDYCGDGGPAISAAVGTPQALVADGAGNIFIAAGGGLREVSPNGTIRSVVPYDSIAYGSRVCVLSNVLSTFATASGLARDRAGNIYIADFGIRKLSPDGKLSVIAGSGTYGYSGDGGPAIDAQINPGALAVDASGNIYFADSSNNVVRVLRPSKPGPLRGPARRGAR